ncbi:hypothetical protein Val02_02670 [Virgisporangium aliadipatigenens]|uniref:Uncharacterized protein n=1 Tax=Virgisporangium aliadipatigenens TaxID=741659 RepID=A0A8J3YE78_9ACTN|nr:hypothetical protein Val02_02670 [Virgisporangium aliadipatigenens]
MGRVMSRGRQAVFGLLASLVAMTSLLVAGASPASAAGCYNTRQSTVYLNGKSNGYEYTTYHSRSGQTTVGERHFAGQHARECACALARRPAAGRSALRTAQFHAFMAGDGVLRYSPQQLEASGDSAGHGGDGGPADDGFRRGRPAFVVAGEAAVRGEPREGPLDGPR